MNLFSNDTTPFELALNQSLKYLGYQPRTVHETREFIRKKGVEEEIAEKIITLLLEERYLDDTAFAQLFVTSKIKHKAKSKFAFGYDLKKKGIASSVIDAVLAPYDDQDLALKAVRRKINTWGDLDPEQFKKKMMNFLRYRGFSYDIILSTLNRFMESDD